MIAVIAVEPLPGDDFYLVSGDSWTAVRNGKPVKLTDEERDEARAWIRMQEARNELAKVLRVVSGAGMTIEAPTVFGVARAMLPRKRR